MNALDGAYVRLARAEEHIDGLKTLNARLVNAEKEAMIDDLRTNIKFGPFRLEHGPMRMVPLEYSALVGEAIYNLRACLDYLVYELAMFDSGLIQNNTQFPIEHSSRRFRKARAFRLNGISDEHAAFIEGLQPYNGVDWVKHLQVISNPDKHMHLIPTQHRGDFAFTAKPDPAYTDSADPPMNVHLNVKAMFITFDDGLPVIDTLEEIKTEVANVLAYFKPEFE